MTRTSFYSREKAQQGKQDVGRGTCREGRSWGREENLSIWAAGFVPSRDTIQDQTLQWAVHRAVCVCVWYVGTAKSGSGMHTCSLEKVSWCSEGVKSWREIESDGYWFETGLSLPIRR